MMLYVTHMTNYNVVGPSAGVSAERLAESSKPGKLELLKVSHMLAQCFGMVSVKKMSQKKTSWLCCR